MPTPCISDLEFALLYRFGLFYNLFCRLIIMIIQRRDGIFFFSLWIIQRLEINLYYVIYCFFAQTTISVNKKLGKCYFCNILHLVIRDICTENVTLLFFLSLVVMYSLAAIRVSTSEELVPGTLILRI